MESGDFEMATAIIETAGIKVTNGSLSETFDEFGHKYQVNFCYFSKMETYSTNLIFGE